MENLIKMDSLQKIIQQGDAEELNKYAEYLGKIFAGKITEERGQRKTEKALSTSQIRNILDEIQRIPKKIESIEDFNKKIKNRLNLLRPKLAYAAGRHGGRVKDFREIVEAAIKLVGAPEHFANFRNFIEAIVAYHRYHGGKE
jgi:CRISPR-associated protein Csm2